ncbi:tetratricopeptide repeat protein [Saccharopolyspora sp. NPDC049357]|uniref:tetratricopeptide repeat protein n=1 Tax=Saccharopolyspora sp. NPDC049357 TaxID=3154507 RepID=UPI00342BDB09
MSERETARDLFERALAIHEQDRDPSTVMIGLGYLGQIHRELGDLATARNHLRRALAVATGVYGPAKPLIAEISKHLEAIEREAEEHGL